MTVHERARGRVDEARLPARGFDAASSQLPPGARAQLASYLDLLAKWNRVYNLTAIRDRQRMWLVLSTYRDAVLPALVAAFVVTVLLFRVALFVRE